MRMVSSLALLLAAAGLDVANAHHVVHERRDSPPAGWVKVSAAPGDAPLQLRIGLAQSNLHRAAEFMDEVSHPDSPSFGRHWSAQQIMETFAPSREALNQTIEWLIGAGIARKDMAPSRSRSWIRVNTTVAEAQHLLGTTYSVYENEKEGVEIVACEEYSLPAELKEHIDLVVPTIQFDANGGATVRQKKARRDLSRRDNIASNFKKLPPWWHHQPDDLSNCSQVTTPACLRAQYHIPKPGPPVKGNSFAIFEYAPQSYNQADLNIFYRAYATNIPNDTAPIVDAIDGGYLSSAEGDEVRGESNLDLEYAFALTYPQPITLYQTGDSHGGTATENTWLDAFDASYCSGDDPTVDPIYPLSPQPGSYNGTNQCGIYNVTKVFSMSYGRDESLRTRAYNERTCTEFLKLGLAGTTLVISSGDTGVVGLTGHCLNPNDDGWAPVYLNGRANPIFPAGCPWVTAVGSTMIPENGTVGDHEVVASFDVGGGFVNHFEIPNYQKAAVAYYYAHHDPGYPATVYNNSQKARGYPDVSIAGRNFIVGIDGVFETFTGTSASAPTFASMISLINAERLRVGKSTVGFINPTLYSHPEIFTDVVSGKNSGCGLTDFYNATTGWDPVSGLGYPDYRKLLDVYLRLP